MIFPIKSKEDFETLMEEVDSALQAQGIPIAARQLRAFGEISKRFSIALRVGPLRTNPIPNVYEGESLSAHIKNWFDQRYGDRLKIDFSIGYSVIMLRGDPWLLKFPLIYAQVTFVCDRDLSKNYNNIAVNEAGKPKQKAILNLLKLIEKLPDGLAHHLTDHELSEIVNYFIFANKFFMTVENFCKENELAGGAITDFQTSARFAVGPHHDHGQSLWASLQAAEKILKFFVASKGNNFPQTHDLSKLARLASSLGLTALNPDLINQVQCKADVRYARQEYPIQQVVDSHQGALKIASLVTESLFT